MALVTWNPSDNTTVLSNGNLTAGSGAPAQTGARATKGVSFGKWYWEIKVTTYGGSNDCAIGAATIGASIASVGSTNYSCLNQGTAYINTTPIAMGGGTYVTGNVIGVALDMDNKKIQFYKNGVLYGASYTINASHTTLYPWVYVYGATEPSTLIANFGATTFDYPIPSGYIKFCYSMTDDLTKRTDLNSLTVGDYIECEYNALSGAIGAFSNLGSATKAEIPVLSPTIPNGKFNFICVERKVGKGGLLIADRMVQSGITWDTLNAAGFIEGANLIGNLVTNPSKAICSDFIAGYEATKACNGTIGTIAADNWYTSSIATSGMWLGYDLTTPTIVTRFNIAMATNVGVANIPKSFRIQGSNDNVTYTTLSTITNTTFTPGVFKICDFNNTTAYRYYRFYIDALYNDGSARGSCSEIQLFSNTLNLSNSAIVRSILGGNQFADLFNKVSPTMTSNSLPSPYTVSATSEYAGTYEAFRLFDGTSSIHANNGGGSDIITLNYGTGNGKMITSYTITGDSAAPIYAPKNFTFEGSNDNSTWTILDTKNGVTWQNNEVKRYLFSNSTSYQYYRLKITATGNSDYVQFTELAFYDNTTYFTGSTVDKGLGGFPSNNEWDKFIAGSTLGSKISAGSSLVWNWSVPVWNWCRETPISSLFTNTGRTARGNTGVHTWSYDLSTVGYGFRPVLEFSEDGNIFY